MSESFEFANLNRLGGVLKNAKMALDNSKMPVQNRKVKESIEKTNVTRGDELDLMDEKPMPNLTEEYYARIQGQDFNDAGNVFGFDEQSISNSKLPQAVLDIMRESQKERSKMTASSEGSLSSELIENVNSGARKRVVTENKTTNVQQQSSGVDYSLIKTIVEDCMKRYTASLKKTMLNENKNSSLEMITQQGNTFRFVTTDGKVFEGKLTYKGNIKEK